MITKIPRSSTSASPFYPGPVWPERIAQQQDVHRGITMAYESGVDLHGHLPTHSQLWLRAQLKGVRTTSGHSGQRAPANSWNSAALKNNLD